MFTVSQKLIEFKFILMITQWNDYNWVNQVLSVWFDNKLLHKSLHNETNFNKCEFTEKFCEFINRLLFVSRRYTNHGPLCLSKMVEKKAKGLYLGKKPVRSLPVKELNCTLSITLLYNYYLCIMLSIEHFHMTSRRLFWCSKTMNRGGHVGVPRKTSGSWTLFSCKCFLLFQ